MSRGAKAGNRGQGSKWIRPEKRARIYARDGNSCVYCGSARSLSLDHLRPRSRGGTNAATNLVTACLRCNVERGNTALAAFVGATDAARLRRHARRVLPKD